jgi:hypothetical protein
MIPRFDEKQIAVKLNDNFISRLDVLAKKGDMNRNHLMLSIINIWISVLEDSNSGLFYISNLFRVRQIQMECRMGYEHEFENTDLRTPEKPLPLKFSESSILTITGLASLNHISRHLFLKTMIIVGIEELEEITDCKPYQFGAVEQELHNLFLNVMTKGNKAFMAYLR